MNAFALIEFDRNRIGSERYKIYTINDFDLLWDYREIGEIITTIETVIGL